MGDAGLPLHRDCNVRRMGGDSGGHDGGHDDGHDDHDNGSSPPPPSTWCSHS